MAIRRRREYNTVRPHRSLEYQPPAPEAIAPSMPASAALRRAYSNNRN